MKLKVKKNTQIINKLSNRKNNNEIRISLSELKSLRSPNTK